MVSVRDEMAAMMCRGMMATATATSTRTTDR